MNTCLVESEFNSELPVFASGTVHQETERIMADLAFFFPGTQCFVLITSNVCIRIIAAKLRKGEEEMRVDRLHKYTYAYVCVHLEITLCTGICHSLCGCVCKQKKVKENLFKGNNCVYNYVCLYGFVSMLVGVGTSILYFRMRYFYGGVGKRINENR